MSRSWILLSRFIPRHIVTPGLALEAAVFWAFTKISGPLDHFVVTHDATLYLPTIVLVIFLLIYPRPHRWTNAYVNKAKKCLFQSLTIT